MWLWEIELRGLGFRRKSDRYWQCRQRFNLPHAAHLSLFSWSEQFIPNRAGSRGRYLIELSEFHVTFQIGIHHVHFYYHERDENEWVPAGHTSRAEIARLSADAEELRTEADAIAAAFVVALCGAYHARDGPLRKPVDRTEVFACVSQSPASSMSPTLSIPCSPTAPPSSPNR